jgi:hypothetical protein
MEMEFQLITPEGEFLRDGSPEAHTAIGYAAPDFNASEFAVKNLGFIQYGLVGGVFVEVAFHPRNVEAGALAAAQARILTSPITLFRIRHVTGEGTWKTELAASADQAIARLAWLCTPPAAPPHGNERYLVTPRDVGDIIADQNHPFRPMVQKWRMSFGTFDDTVIPFAAERNLLSRLMIASVKRPDSEPEFRFIGDGFIFVGQDYLLTAVGQPVRNQPDQEYGEWVTGFYREVGSSRRPRYDHVDAAIKKSYRGPRTIYERLLLPWSTGRGDTLITLSSLVNPGAAGLAAEEAAAEPTSEESSSSARKLAKSA